MEGIVTKAIAGFFYVEYENEILECRASTKLKRNKEKILPGDIVEFDLETKYITAITPRKSELIRPQIANVTSAILVFSLADPKMNFNLLDKLLMTMEYNDLEIIILLTKSDLLEGEELEELKEKINYYSKIGYTVLNNHDIKDKEQLRTYLKPNSEYVITGQTGVGKSTFLNSIFDLDINTQEISKALGRGKHTTRETTFYKIYPEDNIYLIDTPGFSSFEIPIPKEIKRDLFIEFIPYSRNCQFNTCMHHNEPNCAVKVAVEKKEILQSRYDDYIKFLEEK